MTPLTPCLLVGGPLHGNWVAVPEDQLGPWYIPVFQRPLQAIFNSKQAAEMANDLTVVVAAYRLTRVTDATVLVFVA